MKVNPFLLLFFSTISYFLSSSVAVDTVSANQPLKNGNTIVSDCETYELGFFSLGNSKNRYLGIWYKKISPCTVVWVANRETPIRYASGVLDVSREGTLVLRILSGGNTMIWSSNSTVSYRKVTPVARLLDSGNFVFWDESTSNKNPIWQSFDYPGNTLLPGMKFGKDLITGIEMYLTYWKSPDDPSVGKFKISLDIKGYPQLFMGDGLVRHSRRGPWNGLGFCG